MSGHKIFVSYKYADDQVENLSIYENSTVRSYVDELESKLEKSDHIYKGESDGEDLSKLSEEQIWSKIKDRIFDSTLTLVFLSKGMRDIYVADKEQWIPWEIAYSLRTQTRKNREGDSYTSNPNAMIAVVLPDASGSYSYYFGTRSCCSTGCRTHNRTNLFDVLKNNMFNKIDGDKYNCSQSSEIWNGEDFSYIMPTKWSDFLAEMGKYIDMAYERQKNIEEYEIQILP